MRLLIITQKVDVNDSVLGFFHGWISHLAPLVKEIVVIALAKGEHILPANVKVISLGKENKSPKIFQAIRFYLYVLKFLPKSDGVFVHMAPEYVKALYPLNIFLRKPVIMWYAHINVSNTAKWAMRHVQKILTPSKESFSSVSEKVISTGHGIDTEKFSPNDTAKKGKVPVILVQSRISPVKRVHVIIEALALLNRDHPELKFQCKIIGSTVYPDDEKYFALLKDLAIENHLGNQIEWVGWVPNRDMPRHYNEASVFVRLQGGGGFGKTELEAMACGTAVVLPTQVYNESLGEFAKDLYFPEDDVKKCAENIRIVLGWDKDRYLRYRQIAREIVVKNHNLTTLSKKIVGVFEDVINQSK
jgi:glycosyltransferase involved in cell wall biosynthesis